MAAPSEGGELSSYRVKVKGEWTEFLFHARNYSPGPGFKGKGPLPVRQANRVVRTPNAINTKPIRTQTYPGAFNLTSHASPQGGKVI